MKIAELRSFSLTAKVVSAKQQGRCRLFRPLCRLLLLVGYALLAASASGQSSTLEDVSSAEPDGILKTSPASSPLPSQERTTSLLDADTVKKAVEDASAAGSPSPALIAQLTALVKNIDVVETDLKKIDEELQRATAPNQIERLTETRASLVDLLEQAKARLEQVATGAVNLSLFEEGKDKEFSWQNEIKEVFKPILLEMKKLTERPRQIEYLRTQQSSLLSQIDAAELALAEIRSLEEHIEKPELLEPLVDLKTDWTNKLRQLNDDLRIVDFQLNEKLADDEGGGFAIVTALREFFAGRGLHLLLSIFAFIISYIVLRYFSSLIEKNIKRGQGKEGRFFARLTYIISQVLAVLFAIFASMATLYFFGDWLLLTLLIILLVGFVFTLRNSLPNYVEEVRLLLNVGAVREGERVVYRDLPWKVSRLNLHSTLVNPSLTGGVLKLPIREIKELVSRRWSKDEPWFPSKEEDFVLLEDGTFGEVIVQTPEVVLLKLVGGASKSYLVADYLAQAPKNLSRGFGVFVSFGLDYGLQENITTQVRDTMFRAVDEGIRASELGASVEEVRLEFQAANSSSLDFLASVFFDGEVASAYFRAQRILQAIMVDACNNNGWAIPFTQITLHQAGEP